MNLNYKYSTIILSKKKERLINKQYAFIIYKVTYVFPANNWPKWGYEQMWAPEIHYVNGTYYVYFSGHNIASDCLAIIPGSCHSIGVAISETGGPFGPFKDYGKPILEGQFGVIDITWYQDEKYEFNITVFNLFS